MTKAELYRLQRRSQNMAFRNPALDGYEFRHAVLASLRILELVQAECMERPIEEHEIAEATEFLTEHSVRGGALCQRFREGLAIEEPALRFQATEEALRLLRRQFGDDQK